MPGDKALSIRAREAHADGNGKADMPHEPSRRWTIDSARLSAALTAFLVLSSPLAAMERPMAEAKKVFSAKESQEMGDAVRRRDEARQKDWDRKVKAITRGICVGC
jgi:phage-related protein